MGNKKNTKKMEKENSQLKEYSNVRKKDNKI